MASYDSDSSAEEDTTYKTTTVLLGYASKESTDDAISIIGGAPLWLDPSNPPSAAMAKCMCCHDLMPQLLQLHADLPERFPSHERRLHIFACRRRTCARKQGSIRAIRSVKQAYAEEPKPAPAPPAKEPSPPRDLGGSIFGGGKLFKKSGDGYTGPVPQDLVLRSSFAEKAKITEESPATSIVKPKVTKVPTEPWPAERPKAYPMYYLDADYEELDAVPAASSTADVPTVEAESAEGAEGAGASSGADDAEAFESSLDRTFQRFADRLAQNPEQVLRYEFKGTPLLASSQDAVGQSLQGDTATSPQGGKTVKKGMPSCLRCGSPRVFEVQLVPGAIDALEANEPATVEGMEWSTIIVGVCAADCAEKVGVCVHIEEWAGVQWEEVRKVGDEK